MTICHTFNFSGRLSKGQRTKQLILEAAIEVLAKHGIKGTTHRAIANHADIQLSLTTYYFRDIRHLVDEAFLLSSTRTIVNANEYWHKIFALCDNTGKTQLKKLSVRKELAITLALLTTTHLVNKHNENTSDIAVEQLLLAEAQSTEKLQKVALKHRQLSIEPYIKLCCYFNKETAHIDADILHTVFSQLTYQNLITPADQVDKDRMYQVIHRLIRWVLKVKQPQFVEYIKH